MDTSLKAIIESLIEKTKAEEANWRPSSSEGEFSLYLNHATITIGSIPSFNEMTFILRIYNEEGDVVAVLDSSSDIDFESKNLLEKLYLMANDTFLHSKKTIASVIEELKQPGIVGSDTDPKDLPF